LRLILSRIVRNIVSISWVLCLFRVYHACVRTRDREGKRTGRGENAHRRGGTVRTSWKESQKQVRMCMPSILRMDTQRARARACKFEREGTHARRTHTRTHIYTNAHKCTNLGLNIVAVLIGKAKRTRIYTHVRTCAHTQSLSLSLSLIISLSLFLYLSLSLSLSFSVSRSLSIALSLSLSLALSLSLSFSFSHSHSLPLSPFFFFSDLGLEVFAILNGIIDV